MSRVLIIAPAWVGDMVMAQSLVAALKAEDPAAEIDLVAPPWTAPLGERMPGVRRSIPIGAAHGRFDLGLRIALGRQLRAEHYDLAITLPRSFKSALTPFFAGARVRRGYLGEGRFGLLNDIRTLDKTALPRTVDRFVALAAPRGAPAPAVAAPVLAHDTEAARATAARLGLDLARPVIGLCPGAEYGPAKQWPAAHFAEAARELAAKGYAVWIFGSDKDAAIGDEIAGLAGGDPVNLAGRTRLLDAVDLLGLCAGVVTNDSGLMHVAAALGRPLVAVYGSSSPGMTPPLSPVARIAEIELECRPCFQRTCPLGHLNCLKGVTPSVVTGALGELLEIKA